MIYKYFARKLGQTPLICETALLKYNYNKGIHNTDDINTIYSILYSEIKGTDSALKWIEHW